MSKAKSFPASEQGHTLHTRLLAADPIAPSELAEAYLDALAAWLQRHNPGISDPHLCTIAAGEALIALITDPGSYDPARRTLEGYLRMSAQGDLLNLLRKERRHSLRRASLDAVELSPVAGKYLWDERDDPAQIVEHHEERFVMAPADAPGLTPEEARALALMRQGERKTIAYARVLGLDHLPIPEQRREVKRVKDRLKKRLMRAGTRDE